MGYYWHADTLVSCLELMGYTCVIFPLRYPYGVICNKVFGVICNMYSPVDAAGNSLAVQYLMRSIKGNYFLKDQERDEFEIALDRVIFRLPPPRIVGGTILGV